MNRPFLTHADGGMRHNVNAELHVLVRAAEEGGYFAQGLEIDYVSTGSTEAEVRERFQRGLVATIEANIKAGRGLHGLFKSATPPEYWQEYYASEVGDVLKCDLNIDVPENVKAKVPRHVSFMSVAQAA